MSTLIEFSVPAEAFALGRVFEADADAWIDLERVVPTTGAVVPFLWVHGGDPDAIASALDDDERVRRVRVYDASRDRALFRVEWVGVHDGLVGRLVEHDGAVLKARGTSGRWTFVVRFPRSGAASTFQTACLRAGLSLDVQRVGDTIGAETATVGPRLTAIQRETLLVALEEGYFAIPREATLVDLAARLGVSDQAVSERLRRGGAELIRSAVRPNSKRHD